MRLISAAFVMTVLLGCCNTAQALSFEMDMQETDDLRLLYFDPSETYLTPYVGKTFHNSMAFQRYIFNWTPWDKTTVLLKDFSDYGNAAARSSPNNALLIDIAPLSRTFETFTASERIFTLMNHELVHVATMDVWNEQDAGWRRFFRGKPMAISKHPESMVYNYLATPRVNVPRWYLEGSAVFMETWMAAGLGRAQGAYDEMVFRSMVRDDAHFFSALGLVSEGTAVDFQVGVNAYLYGTRFMSYLGLVYSPEKVVEWLSRGEGSERYYSKQFFHVFGKPLDVMWDEWINWEHDFQTENLQAVQQYPLTPKDYLVENALGSISRSFFEPESNTLIGAFRYPGVLAHIGVLSLDDGNITRLEDIKGPMLYRVTSMAWDAASRTAFYTTDNYAFRDLMALDIETGKAHMLLKDARIGDIAFNPADRSLWGIRHLNGYATIVRIPHPYDSWSQVHTWSYGQVLFDMDISPDGSKLSTSMGEPNGDQFLRVYKTEDLLAGKVEVVNEFEFGLAVPEGFVFSPDGRYLFGSSYLTGVSNIFRYEFETDELEAVSNAETGFFRPIPLEDGSLVVYEYTGNGFTPAIIDPVPLQDVSAISFLGAEIANKHPQVADWSVTTSLTEVDYASKLTHEGKYKPVKQLRLGSAYPIIQGYRGEWALGYHMNFEDPMQFNKLLVSASYSPTDSLPSGEKLHVNIEYEHINWHARYWHNGADFYDLFGPTERSRKGDAFIVGYGKALIFDKPRQLDFSADVAYFTGLDTLPGNQNVQTLLYQNILHGQVELNYTNTKKSLAAVDHEKGWRWDIIASADRPGNFVLPEYSDNSIIPKLRAGLDFGFALPWKHSSIWFYNSAGIANGKRLNSLTNYYFGGFGNNYVDDREIKRYRKFYSMPGFEIDEIRARDFFKSVAEWNLPPIRFKSVGSPGFYLGWIRPAVFFAALKTDPGKSYDRWYTSAGLQLDLHFTVSHSHAMTLSLGYAAGFQSGEKRENEVMVSLKIL